MCTWREEHLQSPARAVALGTRLPRPELQNSCPGKGVVGGVRCQVEEVQGRVRRKTLSPQRPLSMVRHNQTLVSWVPLGSARGRHQQEIGRSIFTIRPTPLQIYIKSISYKIQYLFSQNCTRQMKFIMLCAKLICYIHKHVFN